MFFIFAYQLVTSSRRADPVPPGQV